MAKFGNEEIEVSEYVHDIASVLLGSWFTCPEKGVADSITAYFKLSYGRTLKFVIYRKSDNVKVGETEVGGSLQDLGWHTLEFAEPKPVLGPMDYWLLMMNSATNLYSYNGAEGGRGHFQYVTWPTAPDPLEPSIQPNLYSIFCTYTPTPPPANPLISKPLVSPTIAAKPLIR